MSGDADIHPCEMNAFASRQGSHSKQSRNKQSVLSKHVGRYKDGNCLPVAKLAQAGRRPPNEYIGVTLQSRKLYNTDIK